MNNLLEMEPGLATVMSGEPMERADVQPAVVIELLGKGSVIERSPQPVASIAASGVAAEVVLQRLMAFTEGDEDPDGEQFTTYEPVVGDPVEIYGGITVIDGETEAAKTFIRKLIGAVERPGDEEHQDLPAAAAEQNDDGRLRTAYRKSRLAQAVSIAAFTTVGLLSFGTSKAKADTAPIGNQDNVPGLAGGRVLPGTSQNKNYPVEFSTESDDVSGITLDSVDKAVLPLAKDVIRVFRHAKPSARQVTKHTSEMDGMSYQNVTEVSVIIPARVAFKNGQVARASSTFSGFGPGWDPGRPTPQHHPRQGEYTYIADFKGGISQKNLVAMSISSQQDKNTLAPTNIYSFSLARTTHDGPSNSIGMHWYMGVDYARGPSGNNTLHSYASCTANGGVDLLHPLMTGTILGAGIDQARDMLRQAKQHQSIKRQEDVFASQAPAQDCP